jgi:hypothetical protein
MKANTSAPGSWADDVEQGERSDGSENGDDGEDPPAERHPESCSKRQSIEFAETAVPSSSGTANIAASQTRTRTGQARFSRTLQTSLSEWSSSRTSGTAATTRATKPTEPATRAEASVKMLRRVASALSASPGARRRRTRCSIRRSKLSSPSSRSRTRPTTARGTREKMLM